MNKGKKEKEGKGGCSYSKQRMEKKTSYGHPIPPISISSQLFSAILFLRPCPNRYNMMR